MSDNEKWYDGSDPGDEGPITKDNALVVIAQELRGIRRTLHALTFDPGCETVLDKIHVTLHDTLNSWDEDDNDEKSITTVLREAHEKQDD